MSYSLEGEEQERKLFVGGLNKDTNEDELKNYFEVYGTIIDCTIMRDQDRLSRGFGFVLYEDSSSVDKIIAAKKDDADFVVGGHNIQIKRALPKVPGGNSVPRTDGSLYRRIFVGGLPSSITEEELQSHFEQYGRVNEIELLRDRETNRLRGFAFVTFDDEDTADKCVQRRNHEICKKVCEVKRAHTRSRGEGGQDRRPRGYDNREPQQQRFGGPPPAAEAMRIEEVNHLIQQAFLMGQQSQAPTAASLLNGVGAAATAQPASNVLLQALLNQQSARAPAPFIPAPLPVPAPAHAAPADTAALMQIAQLLQGRGIDSNALGALLKGDAQPTEDNKASSYPSSSVTSYDYSSNRPSSYGQSKDDGNRRYNPY